MKQAQFSNLKRSLRPSPAQPPPSHSSASLSPLSPRPPSVTAPRGVPTEASGGPSPPPPASSVPGLLGPSPATLPRPAPGFVPSTGHQPLLLPGGLRGDHVPPFPLGSRPPCGTPLLPRLPPPDFPSSVIASLLLKLQRHLRKLPVPFLLWPLTSSPPLPPPVRALVVSGCLTAGPLAPVPPCPPTPPLSLSSARAQLWAFPGPESLWHLE